jgi:chemotaxis protein CheD
MKKIVDVQIGQVKADKGKVILKSKAIGSCVAIVAYDATKNIGALAHIMLPGKAPVKKKRRQKTRYAADAIDAMVNQMSQLGSKTEDIEVFLVGAANVLRREDDTICRDNIESILELLAKKRLKVKAQALGGTARRSVSMDIERGIVSCAEGNSRQTELWRTKKIPE